MDCNTFNRNINDFIHGKMKDDRLIYDFIKHARSCQDCYEELEIYYTLQTGLDEDSNTSLNFKNSLENLLDDYEDAASISMKIRKISNTLQILANIGAISTLVSLIFFYFTT